ncbi:hypothetical protein CMUS01_04499 [Colletotrichum musicola]|uniref:Uncharacterized protein n=1 Tax=Colletotrichum musicola TaxID=2175873 RepID=A0A8H6NNB6_9PEZI|nr:hypothetical protein CMUS01_04499 [Colletotrichum musicola]
MITLPNQRRHSQDDAGETETETNHLIPARKRKHRVRVQGRLAVVRSVSTVNLRPAASTPPSPVVAGGTTTPVTPRFESGVAGSTVPPARRRRSADDASSDSGEEEHDVKETAVRDRQFRGYGIGGAGNIRRPTEVYGSTKSSSSSSSLSRFSTFYSSTTSDGSDKKPWSLRELFGRTGDRKGKGVATS